MRLLNATSGLLEEFIGAQIPNYAILSHTWGENEVTFSEMQNQTVFRLSLSKASQRKIQYVCDQAVRDGLKYVWVDTCCIDKSSSAELSEAINSMFRWYQQASICYAYLEDVSAPDDEASFLSEELFKERFLSSRWFKRGWTLQELLAPKNVTFFGNAWKLLGTKKELVELIAKAAVIDTETLLDPSRLWQASIARRMSWASERITTRVEDMAYCLLGIFNVNMPLLYGESEKAFIRLQEEIIKYSDDQSLFAWSIPSQASNTRQTYGIFAASPQQFATSGNIVPIQRSNSTVPYTMTNRGLQIELPLMVIKKSGETRMAVNTDKECLGILDCRFDDDPSTCIGIPLMKTHVLGVLVRLGGAGSGPRKLKEKETGYSFAERVYIPREPTHMNGSYVYCSMDIDPGCGYYCDLVEVLPDNQNKSYWNQEAQIMRIDGHDNSGTPRSTPFVSFIFRNDKSGYIFAVRLDIQNDGQVRIPNPDYQWEYPLKFEKWYKLLADDATLLADDATLNMPSTKTFRYLQSSWTNLWTGLLSQDEIVATVTKKDMFDREWYALKIFINTVRVKDDNSNGVIRLPRKAVLSSFKRNY